MAQAAVELFVPLGARFMYGLLGGVFQKSDTRSLEISVGLSTIDQPLFENSLVARLGGARCGLPSQYGAAVMDGAGIALNEVDSLWPGKLSIDRAAHSDVGSSPHIFQRLATILLTLIRLRSVDVTDADLIAIIDEHLYR